MITKIKNLIFLSIAIFIAALLLSACTPPEPRMFGMPQSQWNMLTKTQQEQVMQGYYRKQEIDAENAPMEHAISAARAVIGTEQRHMVPHHQWSPHPPSMPSIPDMPDMSHMPSGF